MEGEIFLHSVLVPAEKVQKTGCFTLLPVRINKRNDIANAATHKLLADWHLHVGDGWGEESHSCLCELGNWCSLIFPETAPDRLGLLTYLTDLGLIHDDMSEEMNYEAAMQEHSDLSEALNPHNPAAVAKSSRPGKLKKLMAQFLLDAATIDREKGIAMVDSYRKKWLLVMEHPDTEQFEEMDAFLTFRRDNGGVDPFWSMCLFGMDISITEAESDSVKDIFQSIDRALVLTNDYWSFDREYATSKKTGAGRIVNAVELIMRTQKLSIDKARQVVKGLVIQHEQDFIQKKEEFYTINPGISISLRRFIEVGGAIIAGNHYWCTQCPRYHSFRDEAVRRSAIPQEIELVPPSRIEEPTLAEIGILKAPPSPPESWSILEPSPGISRSPSDSESSELIDRAPLSSSNQNSSGHGKKNWQKQKHWYKPGSSALESPIAYINSMPSKGVRSALIDALNLWFQIPKQALDKIENIINILHQASLILDDIEDNSALRRSFPSVHTIYGHAQAINSANFMFVKAVAEASTLRSPKTMSIFLDDLENLYLGQSWDLYWKYNLICPTESEYLNMVDNKTGGMFRMLVRLMEAESIVQSTANLTDLTLLLGRFFQIRDDYMNLHSTIYTKQKGFAEDLDEGKFSYPIVHCLQHNSALRDQIIGIFRQRPSSSLQPISPLSQEAKEFILGCLKRSGAMEATRRELLELETDLEVQITSLEEKMGEENPLLRLLLVKLSIRDEFKQSR